MEREKTHPIFIVAGFAVLLFSLLGAAAVAGVTPGASAPAKTGAVAPAVTSSARFA